MSSSSLAFQQFPIIYGHSSTTTTNISPRASIKPSNSNTRAHNVVAEGKRRARALMYGADGAFRGLANRKQQIEQLVRMSGGGFGGNWRNGNNNSNHFWNNDDGSDGEHVDPSWGIAPSVHVILRGRSDAAYSAAVANILSMSAALQPTFVDPSVPVVVILSWMGAQKRQVEKYTKFYEDLGYEVHCVFNDLKTAVFPLASKAQAKKIGSFIEEQPAGRPVFVHAFSIGTGIYGLLLDSLKHEKEKMEMFHKKVTGVIFDSGPAPIFPNDVAKGLHLVCPMVSKAIWESIAKTFFYVTRARNAYGASEDALRKFQFPSPQLYFYSGDDKVISNMKTSVEEFIEKNKQRGVEVYKQFWENSIHASHLKVHPDEYVANLHSFLNRCMELRLEKQPDTLIEAK